MCADKKKKCASKNDDKTITDVESAITKAAKIKADGRLKYNLKLLKELEADKKRKLMVVNTLAIASLMMVFIAYTLYESALNSNWFHLYLQKLLDVVV